MRRWHGWLMLTGLLWWSMPAWALPGPEVLGPLAAAGGPLVAMLGWAAGRVLRTAPARAGWLAVLVGAVVAGLLHGVSAALFVGVVGLAVGRRRPWLLLPVVAVVAVQLAVPAGQSLPPLQPIPPQYTPALAGAVIHVGESTDLDNCRVEHGRQLRPADLAGLDASWHDAPVRWIVLRGGPPGWLGDAAGREALHPHNPGVVCARPSSAGLWSLLSPRRDLLPRAPAGSAEALAGNVWLGPRTPLPAGAAVLEGHEVLSQPSDVLEDRLAGKPVIRSGSLRELVDVARLARAGGQELGGLSLTGPALGGTGGGWPDVALVAGLAGTVLWALCARLFGAPLRSRWAAARLAAGRGLPRGERLLWGTAAVAPVLLVAGLLPPVLVTDGVLAPLLRPVAAGGDRLALGAGCLGLGAALAVGVSRRPPIEGLLVAAVTLLGVVAAAERLLLGPGLATVLLLLPAVLIAVAGRPGAAGRWRVLPALPAREGGGAKAVGLARAAARGLPVPPAVVAWAAAGRPVQRWLGAVPLLVRSSAADEQRQPGGHPTRPAEGADLGAVMGEVLAALPGPDAAVVVMPRLPAAHGGVAWIEPGRVLLERGEGTAGVTSGSAVGSRQAVARWSGEVSGDGLPARDARRLAGLCRAAVDGEGVVEWIEVAGRPWLVQAMDATPGWQARAAAVLGPADRLVQVDGEGLPRPAGPRTLALWAGAWSREGALGRAARALGLPRRLLPRTLVLPLGGALYVHEAAWTRLRLLLQLRAGVGPLAPRLAALWPPRGLDGLAAASIGLRLVQAVDEAGEAPLLDETEWVPDGLCPACAAALPLATPPPLPPTPDLADPTERARLRSLVHAHLVAACAELGRTDPGWARDVPQPVPQLVPPVVITRRVLEGAPPPPVGSPVWVSGEGPLSGVVADRPGPGHLLLLDHPDPGAITPDWAAVLCRGGGLLSHAALRCRQLGLPALFGVGALQAEVGTALVLGADGDVRRG